MTHKISGVVSEPSRLIVLDESDFSTLEYNDTVSGTYDVTVASGSKTVIVRSADGESFGYGAVASKDDGEPSVIPGINNTTWLCAHLDEDPFVDSAIPPYAMANQAVLRSSTQSKFGGYAGYFSGAETQRLSLSRSVNITGSDFTIDFWNYLSNRKTSQSLFYHYYNSTNFWRLYLTATSNELRFESKVNGTTNVLLNADNSYINLNSWQHIALERYNDLYTIFVDGNAVSSVTDASNPYYDNLKYVYAGGNGVLTGYDFIGYMDEIRISRYAMYQGQNFAPSTSAYSTTYDYLDAYTISDAAGVLSFTDTNRLNFTNLQPQHNSYAYSSKGTLLIAGDFEIQFEMKIDSFEDDSGLGTIGVGRTDYVQNGADYLLVTHIYAPSSSSLRIGIREFDGGGYDGDDYTTLNAVDALKHYYYTFKQVSGTCYLTAYNDEARTDVAFSNSRSNSYSHTVVTAIASLASSGRTSNISGFIQNVKVISI